MSDLIDFYRILWAPMSAGLVNDIFAYMAAVVFTLAPLIAVSGLYCIIRDLTVKPRWNLKAWNRERQWRKARFKELCAEGKVYRMRKAQAAADRELDRLEAIERERIPF
jgi:hypothetical protein